MHRLITSTLIILFSACGHQSENIETSSKDSVQQASDLTAIENNKTQKTNSLSRAPENQLKATELLFANGPSRVKLELNEKTVIIVQLDSLEIEQLRKINGEDIFYTIADDLMWCNSLMLEKMDSLGIPVIYTDKDTVDIYSTDLNRTIVKDSTFSIYTYFYFDEKNIKRTELFELIEE